MATRNSDTFTLTLSSDREIVLTRLFDAPRELVFKAYTDPEMIPRWWGQRSATTVVDRMDVRPGGAWRFVQRGADGSEFGFRGEYREIVPPERLVNTESFDESWYPGEAVVTTVLVEQHGRTTLTTTVLYESREARDAVLKSNMEQGVAAGYDKLAEVLASTPGRGTIGP